MGIELDRPIQHSIFKELLLLPTNGLIVTLVMFKCIIYFFKSRSQL